MRHCPTALDVAGSELEELFDEFNLQEEKYRNEILLQEMRKCTLARILLLLCFDDTKSCQEECRNEKLSAVMEYIDNHLTEINTIADIAGGMYISESTIRKMFLEYANIPVMSYVRNKRILLGFRIIRPFSAYTRSTAGNPPRTLTNPSPIAPRNCWECNMPQRGISLDYCLHST